MDNNTYLLVDDATGEAAIVDPSFDSRPIWNEIQSAGYHLAYVLNTHAHFDHIVENAYFVEQSDAPLALHPADLELLRLGPKQAAMFGMKIDASPEPALLLEHGQTIRLGDSELQVVYTPGHAPGHVSFLFDTTAIVGDCLFAGSVGRTDLPGASSDTLMKSIRTQLLVLPDETAVLPGHGKSTTIGRERRTNPFLAGLR
jgi:glyoxylase-like metal-dependent hydrolase (beta-lactamase superfamily II)